MLVCARLSAAARSSHQAIMVSTRATRSTCQVRSLTSKPVSSKGMGGGASSSAAAQTNDADGKEKGRKREGRTAPAQKQKVAKKARGPAVAGTRKGPSTTTAGPKAKKAAKKPKGDTAHPLSPAAKDPTTSAANPVPDIEDLSSVTFTDSEVSQFRTRLLDWYDQNHRELPWRLSPHDESGANQVGTDEFAYRVWVSEIMLQQTQVTNVIGFFNRWMEHWPTVQDLAAATQEEVNEVWAGLGFYRRARFLLEGAKHVIENLGGKIPSSRAELLTIPGIGPYTAAAVSSIAFGQHQAAVDGNVIRVVTRLRCLGGDWSKRPLSTHVDRLAAELLDDGRPGDFNQAMMELGAVQCVKSGKVECGACPVRDLCHARVRAEEDPGVVAVSNWPAKAAKVQQRNEAVATAVLQVNGGGLGAAYVQVQRPQKGLLAGMWEFPSKVMESGDVLKQQHTRRLVMNEYLAEVLGITLDSDGVEVTAREDLGEFKHLFSHIRQRVAVEQLVVKVEGSQWEALEARVALRDRAEAGRVARPNVRLIPVQDFEPESMSSAVRKAFELDLGTHVGKPGQ